MKFPRERSEGLVDLYRKMFYARENKIIFNDSSRTLILFHLWKFASKPNIKYRLYPKSSKVDSFEQNVHLKMFKCSFEQNVYLKMFKCSFEQNVHLKMFKCSLEQNVHLKMFKCSFEQNVHLNKMFIWTKCSFEQNVHLKMFKCSLEQNVHLKMFKCSFEQNVHLKMSKCSLEQNVHLKMFECSFEQNVHLKMSKCSLEQNVHLKRSKCSFEQNRSPDVYIIFLQYTLEPHTARYAFNWAEFGCLRIVLQYDVCNTCCAMLFALFATFTGLHCKYAALF